MTVLSKVSDVGFDDVLEYIRESPDNVENNQIEMFMGAAREYIRTETGEDPDSQPEFVEVYLKLISHMYDNRSMVIDKDTIDPIVTSMLGHHRGNFLA